MVGTYIVLTLVKILIKRKSNSYHNKGKYVPHKIFQGAAFRRKMYFILSVNHW